MSAVRVPLRDRARPGGDEPPPAAPAPARRARGGLLVALLLLALGLRCLGLRDEHLWFDDLFGPLFAQQSLFDMLVCVARFDIHPPLWNLQLFAWAQLGASDTWFMLNSVLWSVLAVGALYAAARPWLGARVATLAAGFLAIHPTAVMYAQHTRMYSMLMVLLLGAFAAAHRYFAGPPLRRALVVCVLSELALAYTHGIGILFAAYIGLYGLLLARDQGAGPARLRAWMGAQAWVVGLSLPAVVNGALRTVRHLAAPGLWTSLSTGAELLLGPGWTGAGQGWRLTWVSTTPAVLFSALVWAGALGVAVTRARARPMALALGLGPVLVVGGLSWVRPLWGLHAFLPLLPFLCSILAVAVDADRRWGGAGGALVAGAMLFGTAKLHLEHEKPTDYEAAMRFIEDQLRPGDVLWAPVDVEGWGAAWYWIGPDWGSPLAVQDPAGPREGGWKRVLDRLDPQVADFFHLRPNRGHVEKDGFRLYFGRGALEPILATRPPRIFIIQTDLLSPPEWPEEDLYTGVVVDLSYPIQLSGYRQVAKRGFTRLWVKRYAREAPPAGPLHRTREK